MIFNDYKENDLDWFINDYIRSRQSIDLSIKKSDKTSLEYLKKIISKSPTL